MAHQSVDGASLHIRGDEQGHLSPGLQPVHPGTDLIDISQLVAQKNHPTRIDRDLAVFRDTHKEHLPELLFQR
jgi:hypothetical protein